MPDRKHVNSMSSKLNYTHQNAIISEVAQVFEWMFG